MPASAREEYNRGVMLQPQTAWVFDVDGVISNPQEKRVTEPEILDHIAEKLEKGEPVALNTGRSLVWMVERVVNPLLEKIKDKSVLQNFFAVGEKGGTWLTFDSEGKMEHHKDDSISVPQSLQEKVRNLIASEFSESMFYDETKLTMISTEMKDGYDLEDYAEDQRELNKKLQELIDQEGLGESLKVDPTVIASDIENRHVGKGFAVERILKWLSEKGIKPQEFVCFGDSISDIPMAEKIHERGASVRFVFVGRDKITKDYPFEIIQPQSIHGKGTLEFLAI